MLPPAHLQMLFTAELNRRFKASNTPIDALCLHPGNVMTEVVRSLPPMIQSAYRALLTHVLFTPQEGERFTADWLLLSSQQLLSVRWTACLARCLSSLGLASMLPFPAVCTQFSSKYCCLLLLSRQ
jgi:hypothetical protein